jgi:hypothetical protein
MANGNAFALLGALRVPQAEIDYCGYFLSSQFDDLRRIIANRVTRSNDPVYRINMLLDPEKQQRENYILDRLSNFLDLMAEAERNNHDMIVWG